MALVRASRNARLLLLVRHGKAAPKNVGLTDFERVLTEEGQADCDRVARDVRMLGLKLDLILSSPADRALETAHLFAGRVNYPYSQIGIVDSLYTSPAIRPQVALIRTLKKSVRTVALCGHNPSFDQLASYFICNPARSLAKGG
ncbi:MAG TPA: histidine phosphatase family protein [Candidatus Acidoferrum sp.]|nr:histidine phosphatase family protein [Candidatus Acidoferrum sp.]